ncbi:MAG: hypothetical protein ACFFG0_02990 [Candidatus Thorarchaeota archaeon]
MVDKKLQGKNNRASGAAFERKKIRNIIKSLFCSHKYCSYKSNKQICCYPYKTFLDITAKYDYCLKCGKIKNVESPLNLINNHLFKFHKIENVNN